MQITDNHKKPDKYSKTEILNKRSKPGNTNTRQCFIFGIRDANVKPQSVKLTTKKHQRNQKCNPEAEAS